MKIKLFGGLRRFTDRREHPVAGNTIRDALAHLCEQNLPLRNAILEGETLRPHVRVMVNGRDSELAQGLDTAVKQGDEIAIFPPIAGGATLPPA